MAHKEVRGKRNSVTFALSYQLETLFAQSNSSSSADSLLEVLHPPSSSTFVISVKPGSFASNQQDISPCVCLFSGKRQRETERRLHENHDRAALTT